MVRQTGHDVVAHTEHEHRSDPVCLGNSNQVLSSSEKADRWYHFVQVSVKTTGHVKYYTNTTYKDAHYSLKPIFLQQLVNWIPEMKSTGCKTTKLSDISEQLHC